MVLVDKIGSGKRIPMVSAVSCDPENGSPSSILSMVDLGEGGIFVQTAYPLPEGTNVKCRFHLGDSATPVDVLTTVKWTRFGPPELLPPPGMGLVFKNLDDETLGRIREVISKHSNNVEYFRQNNRLPEDAFALSPPKMTLLFEDDTALEGTLDSINENHYVATVALPFLKESTALKTIFEDGNALEQGKISWLSFVEDGGDGIPAIKMGVELSLSSWGEEVIKKVTSPLGIVGYREEIDSEELEYDIIEAIPTSLTVAPTLPLENEEITQGMWAEVPPPPEIIKNVEPKTYPAPIRTINITKTGVPQLIPLHNINKKEVEESGIVTSGPVIKEDTFPIAIGGSIFNVKKRAALAIFITTVTFGAILLLSRNDSKASEQKTDIKSQKSQTNKMLFPYEKEKITKGKAIDLGEIPPGPKLVEKAPVVTKKDEKELPLVSKKSEKKSVEPIKKKELPKVVPPPVKFYKSGKKTLITFGLSGAPKSISHYILANPHGIVVDVKGAKYALSAGYHKAKSKKVKKYKAIKRKKGGRLIIYTKNPPKKVSVSLKGPKANISFR